MTIYPVEFQRRLEQKWASRIERILPDIGKTTPPRDPNDDDDDEEDEDEEDEDEEDEDEEDEDEEDEDQPDQPAVVREPDGD
jgi:hypothetical protein